MKHLWTVLWTLNERIRRGHPVLVEVLLSQTIAPIQLQVQTKDALLKPGMGKQGNILLPALEGLERGQTAPWTWPWELKASHMCWVALGAKGGEKLTNSALGDWDMGRLKGDISRASRP